MQLQNVLTDFCMITVVFMQPFQYAHVCILFALVISVS
jgi:hypothetical protein